MKWIRPWAVTDSHWCRRPHGKPSGGARPPSNPPQSTGSTPARSSEAGRGRTARDERSRSGTLPSPIPRAPDPSPPLQIPDPKWGYKTRVNCLRAVQPTRGASSREPRLVSSFPRAPRSHPLRANHSPPPDLGSKPPSALIAAGSWVGPSREGAHYWLLGGSLHGDSSGLGSHLTPRAHRVISPRLGGLAAVS